MNLNLVALGLVLSACTTALAPPLAWTTEVNSEEPRYPHARFITGVGLSSTAADDADARAKENVALQISTRLESETSSFQSYTTQAGTSETITSRVSVRSSFDRADLIRVVDRTRQSGVFYSYAVLERAATDRELGASMSADLASFRAAAESARRAHGQQDAAELDVTPEEKCSEGALGERCEVVVRLVAQSCSGGASGAATVATARGIHPSDRERARKLAWDKVTAQAVEAAVRDALKGTILIGE